MRCVSGGMSGIGSGLSMQQCARLEPIRQQNQSLCVLEYALFQQRNDARNGFDFEAWPFVREEFESLWLLPARFRPKKPWLRAENLDHRPGLRGCGASGVEGQGVWMHSQRSYVSRWCSRAGLSPNPRLDCE